MTTMTMMNSREPLSRIGYGAMVLEGLYGDVDEASAVATLQHAIDRGAMIDTADAYGAGRNEALVARALKGRRDDAFVATKFGIVFDDAEPARDFTTGWGHTLRLSGTVDYAARALDASLKRLESDVIDLHYIHFPDPDVAIEESVGAMARGVEAGKVRYLGLSNVTAEQGRRAHAVHPIAAVQYEYSLWRRDAEKELLPTLRELGIALVAWSPLGAGFLAGDVQKVDDGDFRTLIPRFSQENLAVNRDRFAPLRKIADEVGVTPAQLALAWLANRDDAVYAIPGSRKTARVDENLAAADIRLSDDVLARIDAATAAAPEGATLL